MKDRPHRVYLDSNVIIAYLKDEVNRASVVESLFEDAQDKKVELVTSVLSVTEVAFIASDQASGNPLEFEFIRYHPVSEAMLGPTTSQV